MGNAPGETPAPGGAEGASLKRSSELDDAAEERLVDCLTMHPFHPIRRSAIDLDISPTSSGGKRQRDGSVGLQNQTAQTAETNGQAAIKTAGLGTDAVVGPDAHQKRFRTDDATSHGEDPKASMLGTAASRGDDDTSKYLAIITADRLRVELEEMRVLREQDKQRYEMALAEADSAKGKLLRQVKFLAEEEEEARAECQKKKEAFLAETAKLQEALGSERAAHAATIAEGGRRTDQDLQGLQRRRERENLARQTLEQKVVLLEGQVRTRTKELAELRQLRRKLDVENADLSLELAKLRREAGAGCVASTAENPEDPATVGTSSWDNAAARELRARIKDLEKEAQKRELLLQGLQHDHKNTAVLEDRIETLEGHLQSANAALREALATKAECSAIKDEKEEWSLLFSKAFRDQRRGGRVRADRREGGALAEASDMKLAADDHASRPGPVIALRLLLETQQERSLAVKELAALKLRDDSSQKRLAQLERDLKTQTERANLLQARAEDMRVQVETLTRRYKSAEHETLAQKELIESYERDTFRKPAKDAWLSEHRKLETALAAAKEEARALREAADGQVSALEAGRLRTRIEAAEKTLQQAVRGRKESLKTIEELHEKLEGHEKAAANGTGLSYAKVLHMKDNPSAIASRRSNVELKKQIEALKEDNGRLVRQLESAGAGAVDTSTSSVDGASILGSSSLRGGEAPDVKKFSTRLQETYRERVNFYRESVYRLTGYRIDMIKDPSRQVLRLRSMYAEHESDCLLFQYTDEGLHLVESPLALQHTDKIGLYLQQCDSIPAFLSTLTLEWFEKQTVMPR